LYAEQNILGFEYDTFIVWQPWWINWRFYSFKFSRFDCCHV